MSDFNVKTVRLEGNNTIEASAGTGKTYSLAILVLRLLLEKKLSIEQILLVTFTESAAAELKERTAKFIRLAFKETQEKGSSKEGNIEDIIDKSKLEKEEQRRLLQQALLDIDKATMTTIHSFCKQTLIEFAFETGQEFGKELVTNTYDIVLEEVNQYMRSLEYQQNFEILSELKINDRSKIIDAVEKKIVGVEFYGLIQTNDLYELTNLIEQKKSEVISKFDHNLDSYRTTVNSFDKNGYKRSSALKKIVSAVSFYEYLGGKSIGFHFKELFADEIDIVRRNISEVQNIKNYVTHYHLKYIAEQIIPNVRLKLLEKNALTFNELIQSLYNARENPDLIELMREKYKAVFVDEFQDTDPQQYGIFKTFFQDSDETVLFVIGDPKQSIYGWRQADVETYKSARDSSGMKRLKMNTNYRSSAPFIDAANNFFELDAHSKLNYIKVKANDTNTVVGLVKDDEEQPAIQLVKSDSEQDAKDFTKEVFHYLFSKEIKLKKHQNGRDIISKVSPANVAVLVRNRYEANDTKRVLDNMKIPSVVIAEQNVFESQEAKELRIILTALLNISKSNVQYALITKMISVSIDELWKIDDDVVLPLFYECKSIWEKEGISKMMEHFFQFFNVIERHSGDPIGGHQILANTRQIIEILQTQTLRQALTPTEVLVFLTNQIKNPDANNEAYQQSVENDEKAVKIMTIHKAKGLEFDIIVLPYLNSEIKERGAFTSFRKELKGKGKYYFVLKGTTGEPLEAFNNQQQEENERLLYVAVTRAKYNAFIFGESGEHLLSPYINGLESQGLSVEFSSFQEANPKSELSGFTSVTKVQQKLVLGELSLSDSNYHKLSYSFLASKHAHHPKEELEFFDDTSYDYFIFKELPRGAHIGNVLHDMFEFSDFTDDGKWNVRIEQALRKFYPSALQDEEKKRLYVTQLSQLMSLVVNTPFTIDQTVIKLSDILNEKRINELEFNFPITKVFNPSELEKVIDNSLDRREIATTSSNVRGMMNGFVDLFFEHEGKYYILDWKSNFLGDQLEKYSPDKLVDAMSESNYHLQYLLYSVAIDKFISSRLGGGYSFDKHFGGVVYVFLRGVREKSSSGFYTQTVSKAELDKCRIVLEGGSVV